MARPKSNQRFKVREITNPGGSTSYIVDGYTRERKRPRPAFDKRSDALERMAQMEAEESEGLTGYSLQRTYLTQEELRDAEVALGHAGGKKLSEIVLKNTHVEQALRKKPGISIDEAIAFTQKHYRPEIKEISIQAAREEYLRTRGGITAATLAHYGNVTKPLSEKDPNKKVHEFNVRDLNNLLATQKNPNSRRTYQAGFGIFFNWAMRNHYCLENPCDRLDKAPSVTSNIEILSLDAVKQLLKASLLLHDGAMAPSIAILLFAGLRPSELSDLEPKDIRKDVIRVKGGKLRREINRSVPIPPVLQTWLKAHPFTGKPSGWRYKSTKLKEASGADNWVNDILRHTSISYQLERDKDEARTAFHCGTSTKMINRHYRDVIDEGDDIDEFWDLTPSKVRKIKLDKNLNQQDFKEWPTDSDLKKLVWQKPLSHLAKDLNCTDQAIRKRCLKHGIDLPKNGHWQRVNAGR